MQKKRLYKKIILLVVNISILLILLRMVSLYSKVLEFKDPGLEAAIREKNNNPHGLILRTKLKNITHLDASGYNIKRLEGIEHLTDLVFLNLENNQVEDLSPLRQLNKLSLLNISENKITDLGSVKFQTLRYLPLRRLNMSNNWVINAEGDVQGISLLPELRFFTSLERLDLSGNQITDITPLRSLINLRVLNLNGNQIKDISALANLKGLKELNLRQNLVSDMTPLSGLTDLSYLNLHSNRKITSLKPMANLTGLKTLIMPNIPIGDQLGYLRNLTNLERLNVRNCGIRDSSILLDMIVSGALQDNPEFPQERAILDVRDNPLESGNVMEDSVSCETWIAIDNRFHYLVPSVCRTEPPAFSHFGGFYDGPFQLSITHPDPDVTIIYTLDGSYPDINNLDGTNYMYKNQYPLGPPLYNSYISHIYSGPIEIYDRSEEPNKISQIASTPFGASEFIPQDPIQKATVVRAVAIKPEGIISMPETHTFFIDTTNCSFSLPIVSISIQENYLFDYFKGIYSAGYDADIWSQKNPGANFTWVYPGNYNRRGFMWEYPANLEFFTDDKSSGVLNQQVGIRIHGGGTRSFPMKSLRVYAQDLFGPPELRFPFFSNDKSDSFKTLILRNSGNDFPTNLWGPSSFIGTMIRDAAIQRIMNPLNLDTQGYRPVIVYLNGEYWGIHNIRERIDKYFLERAYGVDPDSIDFLTSDSQIVEGDNLHFKATLKYIEENGLEVVENYNYILSRIDIKNFVDYQIANIFAANTDWPGKNNDYWRLKTLEYLPEARYGHDGRWRWMLYDMDFGFGFWKESNHNTLFFATELGNIGWSNPEWSTFLFRNLLENDSFRNYFINRFADLLNTVFLPDLMTNIIYELKKQIEPEIPTHLARWKPDSYINDWFRSVEGMINFSMERPGIQRDHIREFFGLYKNVDIFLNVSEPQKGHIIINTLKIIENTPGTDSKPYPWEGIYFTDIPIELEAVPTKNHRFVGWLVWPSGLPEPISNDFYSTEPILNLKLDSNTSIKAIFR